VSAETGDADALLRRFKPQLRYDSQEAFFADSAAEMTRNPHNTLRRAPHDNQDDGAFLSAAPHTTTGTMERSSPPPMRPTRRGR
jgi:hypothetical protein